MTLTPSREANDVPAPDGEALGVWLSLDQLRALPLPSDVRADVLRVLLDTPGQELVKLTLQGQLAELILIQCKQAYDSQQWPEALRLHDELLVLVRSLTEVVPELADAFWSRYGLCLAFLTAAVAESMDGDDAPPLDQALLCSQMAERLEAAAALPIQAPEWLSAHEENLLYAGTHRWMAVRREQTEQAARAREQVLTLLCHLRVVVPCWPDWVKGLYRELLQEHLQEMEMEQLLQDPQAAASLLRRLDAIPIPAERQGEMDTALLRTRLTLELINPPAATYSAVARDTTATTPIRARDFVQPPDPEPAVARLVFSTGDNNGETVDPLAFPLEPLLGADGAILEERLDDFVWHLPKGCLAAPATSGISAALEPQWRQGLRLPPAAFGTLAVLAATWQRRFGERVQPLPQLDWQFNLVVELAATELATLALLMESPEAVMEAMTQLRREHRNPAFWQQRQEVAWFEVPPPVEVLRRLHVEEGFYASGHDPLQDLRGWGEEVLRALGGSELWTDDAGCLGLWLRVAEQMAQQTSGPLPLLGRPPEPQKVLEALAGAEVVYVGDQAAAVHAAHREGRCFRGGPFGLRVLDTPASHWPARPAASFALSQATLLERLDGLYRERPFAVLLADCGAYRLPLLQAAQQRYGISGFSSGRPMALWLGA